MHLDIEHDIHFTYSDFISESWVELRVEPKTNALQTVNSFILAVGPRTKVFRYEDWHQNAVRHFSIAEYHKEIEVRARTVVETKPLSLKLESIDEPVAAIGSLGAVVDYLAFDGPITNSPALREMFDSMFLDQSTTLGQQVQFIGNAVNFTIKYMPNVTTYRSTIDDALSQRAGVCQDLAQIMIGLLRLAGIPARYVSGYVFVPKSETSESHAWVEFFSKKHGWVGFDPTACIQPGERHVVVATARHYDEVPPNRGVYRGKAREKMKAVVRIKAIPAPAFSSFREEIRDIELPVYSEFPGRHLVGTPEEQMEQSNQQQQ